MHYLDNAATTPVRPEAIEAACRAMGEQWGNLQFVPAWPEMFRLSSLPPRA